MSETVIEMIHGPIFNNTERRFTTRDSLGIEGVANTISADLCPVVNTVTPRPFYWVFISWCYWKFYQLHGYIHESEVHKFIEKNNYFIALGNYLAGSSESGGFIGSSVIGRLKKNYDSYKYNDNYIKGLSTMGYYPPGLETMQIVVKYDRQTEKTYTDSRIRPRCEKLAMAFDLVISNTVYYQQYLFAESIPRTVLEELGETVHIDLHGFTECKKILYGYLFETGDINLLGKNKDYILYIKNHLGQDVDTAKKCRMVFFDAFSPRGNNGTVPEELSFIAKGWEIVAGRHYFTVGLELIWEYMLKQLAGIPKTKSEWIETVLESQTFEEDINSPLHTILDSSFMNSSEMEEVLLEERSQKDSGSLERGLSIILSVYNRFVEREDYDESLLKYYLYGGNDSISFEVLINDIQKMKDYSIRDFLVFVMKNYLINQHLRTAFNKMIEGRDGYYIEELNGKYLVSHNFYWGFQGNRMVQLYSVMKDLGVI